MRMSRTAMAGMGLVATVMLVAGCGQQSTPHPSMAGVSSVPTTSASDTPSFTRLPDDPFNAKETACRPDLGSLDPKIQLLCRILVSQELQKRHLNSLDLALRGQVDVEQLSHSHCRVNVEALLDDELLRCDLELTVQAIHNVYAA